MDYASYYALGPLIDSFLVTFGAGPAPMIASSAAWEIRDAAYQLLSGEVRLSLAISRASWQGVSEDLWQKKFSEYASWAEQTALASGDMAKSDIEMITAWTTCLITCPPFAVVLANRVLYETLNILNISTLFLFAIIIVPIMIALDIQYHIMRIQAAIALATYSSVVSAIVSSLPEFTPPPRLSELQPPIPYLPGIELTTLAATAAIVPVFIPPNAAISSVAAVAAKPKQTITKTPLGVQELGDPPDEMRVMLPSPQTSSTSSSTSSQSSQVTSSDNTTPVRGNRVIIRPPRTKGSADMDLDTDPPQIRGTYPVMQGNKNVFLQNLRNAIKSPVGIKQSGSKTSIVSNPLMDIVLDNEEEEYIMLEKRIGFNDSDTDITRLLRDDIEDKE